MCKKRIILINTDLPYGGGAMMIVWLANVLVSNGFYVTFLTYRYAEKGYLQLDKSIEYISLRTETHGHSMCEMFHTVKKIRNVLHNRHYDLGIAFLSPSQLRLGLAAWGTNTKVLFSHRADPYLSSQSHTIKDKLLTCISNRLFCSADGLVFQTDKARDFYSRNVRLKSVVIPNPVRRQERTEQRCQELIENRIVSVARLDVFQKRQDLLIEAFNIVSAKHPDYILELYGDGPDEALLRDKAAGNRNIVFKGVSTNIISSIQHASMLVLTSDFEGIPNVLLEAMSLAIPCISTDCSPGGAALLIENEKNGLLVPKNDVHGLVAAINRFIENKAFAEECGGNAVEVRNRFAESKIAGQWIEYISTMAQ